MAMLTFFGASFLCSAVPMGILSCGVVMGVLFLLNLLH